MRTYRIWGKLFFIFIESYSTVHRCCRYVYIITSKVLAVPFFSRSSMISMLSLMELSKPIDDGFKFEVSKW
jgi:hypothetical protein